MSATVTELVRGTQDQGRGAALPGRRDARLDGIPAKAGRVIAHSAPDWRYVLRDVLHARGLGLYFVALLAWGLIQAALAHDAGSAWLMIRFEVALVSLFYAVLGLYAWATARQSVYVLTETHLTMRIGVALTLTVSMPLSTIDRVDLRTRRGGSGDILLTTSQWPKLPYVMIWPHARPWRWSPPQPMLRALARPDEFAAKLVSALEASAQTAREETS